MTLAYLFPLLHNLHAWASLLQAQLFRGEVIDFLGCKVFSCVSQKRAKTLNVTRLVLGTINTTVASIFAYLLCRYNQSRSMIFTHTGPTRKINKMKLNITSSQLKVNLILGYSNNWSL